MRLTSSLAIVIGLGLVACSPNRQVVYISQDVYIPVACLESMPPKPKLQGTNSDKLETLMRDYLRLRAILYSCTLEEQHDRQCKTNTTRPSSKASTTGQNVVRRGGRNLR